MKKSGYDSLRAELRTHPPIHYERLEPSPRSSEGQLKARIERTLLDGWNLGDSHLKSVWPPIAWTHPNRSFEYHIHAWEPITYLLSGYEELRDERCLKAALAYGLDWLSVYQEPLLTEDRPKALAEAEGHTETKAWYDMGVGQRAYRLGYITDVVGRATEFDTRLFAHLIEAVRFHLDLLARDSFFVAHTNHGLYQTLGQMAAARRFAFLKDFRESYEQATERLDVMFGRSFFDSGVHREHSPGYHHMILGTLLGARASGLLRPEMTDRLVQAEEALGWMIGPHGTLATIGDTDLIARSYAPDALVNYRNPHVLHLLSGGRAGSPPPNGMKAYADAGAVFIRSGDTYLAQTTAFHSRTHKHADHLSFIWWEGAEEVLIDPGRFGYLGKTDPASNEAEQGFWYSDPRRIYVEKTRAHNCIEVDGKDYPRRRTTPWGSALQVAEQQADNLFVTTCETHHFRRVRHRRDLVLRPGHFLLVLDWLYDRSGQVHDFKQWFQLAPQWAGCPHAVSGNFSSSTGAKLWIGSLLDPAEPTCYRGELDPQMSGWRSDKAESLVPTTSLHFSATGERAAFATVFVMREVEATGRSRANRTLSAGRFEWRERDGVHLVSVSRTAGRLQAAFE